MPDVMTLACHPITWELEVGESKIGDKPAMYSENLCQEGKIQLRSWKR